MVKNSIIFKTQNGKIEMAGDPLKNYIISRIKSGELKPGMPLLSTQELSHRFGISLITAQKVLKELGDKNYLVRQRGKRTVIADSSLRKPNIDSELVVGVLFSGIDDNPFHAMLLAEIYDYGFKHNIKIISQTYKTDNTSFANFELFLDKLKSNNIEYCIQNPQLPKHYREIWSKTADYGITTVMLNDFWHSGGPFSCIRTHEEYGHEMIFNHFYKLGHRRIMLLDETRNIPRLYAEQAFKQFAINKGWTLEDNMIRYISDTRISPENIYSKELVDDIINNYTAIYCTYDIYALRLMEILTNAGIKVGKDISIAGFDNIPMAKAYGLTTIAHPIKRLVTKTFEELFKKEQEPICFCLQPELIIRNSTGQRPDKK